MMNKTIKKSIICVTMISLFTLRFTKASGALSVSL